MEKETLNFSIQWHITSNCVNRCKHCYMYDDNYVAEDCSYEEFALMFQNVNSFFDKYGLNLPDFVITGGSPLMNPECERILKFLCSKINRNLMIFDVPEMLTEKNIELLKACKVSCYQVSLDGMKEEHDFVRGKGSFDRTIEGCKRLSLEGIQNSIMFTVSHSNYEQLIPLCKYLIQELEAFSFGFDFVVPFGNAAKMSGYISPKQADDIMEQYYWFAKKYTDKKKEFILKPSRYHVYERLRKDESLKCVHPYPMISGCHIGWDSICVLQNGDVLPCRRLPLVIGNLKRDSFEDIFLNSELLRKFRRFSLYQEKCGICQYGAACRGCPAITYALTGNCFGKYPLCAYEPHPEDVSQYSVPDMTCSTEEELKFINTSMYNSIEKNAKRLFELYPDLIKYVRTFEQIKTREEYISYARQLQDTIGIDEEYCLASWLNYRFGNEMG